jgi:hypothetical protein
MLVAGDAVRVLPQGARVFPGLGVWGADRAGAARDGGRSRSGAAGRRPRAVRAGGGGRAVAFTGLMAAFPALAVDPYKAPKELVRESGVDDPGRDVRLAHCGWFQPSLVFYARREVVETMSAEAVAEFLAVPTPGYVFVPAAAWEERVKPRVGRAHPRGRPALRLLPQLRGAGGNERAVTGSNARQKARGAATSDCRPLNGPHAGKRGRRCGHTGARVAAPP